jgi:uncharacterized protein (DUF2461 family)
MKDMRTHGMRGRLFALAAAGVMAVLLFGSVTAANAHATNRTQAVRAARQYLQTMPFSFKGLVKQLKFEGYSTSDATYGASHSGANWMAQAVNAARQYLQTMPFSFRSMVEQLQFDGFTHAQAVHGARAAHL